MAIEIGTRNTFPICATFTDTVYEIVVTESQPKSYENSPIYKDDEMKLKLNELAQVISKNGEEVSIITILEEIQARYRYLPHEAMILVSDWSGVPLSQLYSVATFYNVFSLIPRGEHTIEICTGTACHVRGAIQVLDRLESKLGIVPGETTKDRKLTLETVNCLGCCALGPVAVVDGKYVGQMTTKKADKLIKHTTRHPGTKS